MRTVYVDGLMLGPRFAGVGISRYLTNLLCQIEVLTRGDEGLGVRILVPPVAESNGRWVHRLGFEFTPCAAMRFQRMWKLGLSPYVAKRVGADVLFLPSPSPISLKPARLAVTVHDIIPILFPREVRPLTSLLFRHSCLSSTRKADLILTDSERSKADMASLCGVPEEKIVVAYLGCDPEVAAPGRTDPDEAAHVLKRYGITPPYVLHVGRLEARKNVVRLVEAYRSLCDRRKDFSFQLVVCGGAGRCWNELVRLASEPALRGRMILTGSVPDHELAVIYRAAACLALPSLYEGFGLPLLEAMASGTPVMSSNRSSLPEVGGDAALYFNPESVEEMSATMERLLGDSTLQRELIRRGLERSRQFSWKQCAETTLAALKNLADS